MEDQEKQLKKLFQKSEWTAEEMQWLLSYLENTGTSEFMQIMQKEIPDIPGNSNGISHAVSDNLLKAIHENLNVRYIKPAPRVIYFRKIAVAASVIGLLLLSGFLLYNKFGKYETAQISKVNNHRFKNDVLPGGAKATLTLADGSTILLDEAQNGILTQQGSSKVVKLDGKLSP